MIIVLYIIGILEIVGGGFAMMEANGVIQQIAGILFIGFGFLTMGLVAIAEQVKSLRKEEAKRYAEETGGAEGTRKISIPTAIGGKPQ